MKKIDGGLETVPGYKFSSIKCGIRYDNRLDYSLIAVDNPSSAAGVFTQNRICAAPVKISKERISGPVRLILINATNANACTGDQGYNNALMLTGDIASKMNLPPESVLMASTGIIGRQLPLEKMMKSHDELISGLSQEMGKLIPAAIMTTDTFPKTSAYSFKVGGSEYRIAGTAKGSGMIAPDMATLLAFIVTDLPVPGPQLQNIFKETVDETFNAITIDGDTSTNDTAVILAPVSESQLVENSGLNEFRSALTAVLSDLSRLLVQDAEGGTKCVTIKVVNALNKTEAVIIARSIAQSLLVKTAIFGNDPNWGRIAAAAGYSGASVEEKSLTIKFNNLCLLDMGVPRDVEPDSLKNLMTRREYTVTVDIGLGDGSASMLTSDISYDYVKINAEYST